MPATSAWLAAVESVLNRNIDQSLKAAAAARGLDHTSLQIDIEGLGRFRAAVSAGRLALTAAGEPGADATISGSPLALFDLLTGATGAGRAQSNLRLRMTGDAEIAGRYRELFTLARPDLEEELSRLIGDLPARRVSLLARAALSWGRRFGRTAGENLAEYLQEESRDLVNQAELEEFLAGVDRLRETADRVEARLARAEQRLKGMT
jgi:ubiquinone biosynthesis accessory factor UbiJ